MNNAEYGSFPETALIRQGAVLIPAKGSHFRVLLNGRQSILPMHSKDIPTGTVEAIKKQLGLK